MDQLVRRPARAERRALRPVPILFLRLRQTRAGLEVAARRRGRNGRAGPRTGNVPRNRAAHCIARRQEDLVETLPWMGHEDEWPLGSGSDGPRLGRLAVHGRLQSHRAGSLACRELDARFRAVETRSSLGDLDSSIVPHNRHEETVRDEVERDKVPRLTGRCRVQDRQRGQRFRHGHHERGTAHQGRHRDRSGVVHRPDLLHLLGDMGCGQFSDLSGARWECQGLRARPGHTHGGLCRHLPRRACVCGHADCGATGFDVGGLLDARVGASVVANLSVVRLGGGVAEICSRLSVRGFWCSGIEKYFHMYRILTRLGIKTLFPSCAYIDFI